MECPIDDTEICSPSTCQPLCQSSSANSSQQVYTPQVRNELIPKIGQHFDTVDEVQTFYNNYAREGGFGTRINSSKKSRDNQIIRKEYCCYKEGVRKTKAINSEPSTRRRGLTREGCGAKLSVVKDKSGVGFVVSQFFEGHNHPLTTPKRVHLLHSHREVSNAKKALTKQLSAANVPTCQQMSILAVQSGGIENVGCSQQDLYNVERDRRKELLGQDANMLLEYFKLEQKKNPGFTYAIKCPTDGIACRHILAYFNFMHIRKLPDNYILRRWTKSAKAGRVREDSGGGSKEICDTSVLMRRSKLFLRSSNVIDEAVLTEEGSEIYNEALDVAEKKLAALKLSRGEDGEESGIQVSIPLGSADCSLKEPNVARPKGCGKRIKGGKEKSVIKKKRRCHCCGEIGASHDKRNCPKLLAMSSQASQMYDEDEDDDDDSMDYDED